MYHLSFGGWSKSSFGFFCKILWKSPNQLFGQPNSSFFMHILTRNRQTVNWFLSCSKYGDNGTLSLGRKAVALNYFCWNWASHWLQVMVLMLRLSVLSLTLAEVNSCSYSKFWNQIIDIILRYLLVIYYNLSCKLNFKVFTTLP